MLASVCFPTLLAFSRPPNEDLSREEANALMRWVVNNDDVRRENQNAHIRKVSNKVRGVAIDCRDAGKLDYYQRLSESTRFACLCGFWRTGDLCLTRQVPALYTK